MSVTPPTPFFIDHSTKINCSHIWFPISSFPSWYLLKVRVQGSGVLCAHMPALFSPNQQISPLSFSSCQDGGMHHKGHGHGFPLVWLNEKVKRGHHEMAVEQRCHPRRDRRPHISIKWHRLCLCRRLSQEPEGSWGLLWPGLVSLWRWFWGLWGAGREQRTVTWTFLTVGEWDRGVEWFVCLFVWLCDGPPTQTNNIYLYLCVTSAGICLQLRPFNPGLEAETE